MPKDALKFLIDIGVGKKVETWLKEQGYDLKTLRDLDPRMEDAEILRIARAESRMIVTMDKDFKKPGTLPVCADGQGPASSREVSLISGHMERSDNKGPEQYALAKPCLTC